MASALGRAGRQVGQIGAQGLVAEGLGQLLNRFLDDAGLFFLFLGFRALDLRAPKRSPLDLLGP